MIEDEIGSDREFRILSTMLSPEEMNVVRFFKLQNSSRNSDSAQEYDS